MSMMPLSRHVVAITLLCLLLCLFSASFSGAQDTPQNAPSPDGLPQTLSPVAHFTHLTSDDGLIQNGITSILQDSRGFMWFGTQAGLSRYDGYHFTNYQHDSANPNSLSNNYVRDLYEDADGILWVGTEGGGVSRYDPQTETFTRFLADPQNPDILTHDRIFDIFQERSGAFWYVGGGLTGLNRYDPSTGVYRHYATNPNDPTAFHGGAVNDMVEDENGDLWLAASPMLAKYDPAADSFTYYEMPPLDGRREDRLALVHQDADGRLWIGGSTGFYEFDREAETFIRQPIVGNVGALFEAGSGEFWLATSRGIQRFDPHTSQVTQHYEYNALDSTGLNSNDINEIYQDREGLIWIGTRDEGVNIYNPQQTRFAHYRHEPDNSTSLADGSIGPIFASEDGPLWVGIDNTLDRVDLENGQVTHFPLEELGGEPGAISAVYQDHEGIIWAGGRGMALYSFNPETGRFTPYPLESAVTRPTPSKVIIDFYEDDAGFLWIAVNHDGLYRLDPSRETVEFFDGPPSASAIRSGAPLATAPHPPITDILGDQDGTIWLTTLNGFMRFDPRSSTYDYYRAQPGEVGPDSYMEAILKARNGLIWIASRDGLIRFDPATETAIYFAERNGLPSSFVVSLQEDAQGDLWLGTARGLSRFTPSTETFRNFDLLDGLQSNEFTIQAFAQTADGHMVFGGANGINAFYPEAITDSTYQPPVILTDFQLANVGVVHGENPALPVPIWNTNALTLDYFQNNLSFEFAALSYAAPQKIRYRYMLEGFDDTWNETSSNRRFATYTNLPAGSYVLRVQATNADGVWSEQEVSLDLTMQPPLWETLWFRSLVAILIVGLVLAGYQWRVYAIARRNRDLESEVAKKTSALQERTQALQTSEAQLRVAKEAAEAANRAKSAFIANMSHELRSPLNAILGFAQVTNRILSLPTEVYENLGIVVQSGEHLLALINQVLDLSKIEAGQMTLNETNFDLHSLLDDLEKLFILKADSKQLKLIFERDADVPRYLHTDAVKVRQVLINLISNALKFTETGAVNVRVHKLASDIGDNSSLAQLQFEVQDTGPGIAADELSMIFDAFNQSATGRQSQEGTGLGLTISRRFVHLMGGEITVNSQVGRGTTFKFNMQCQIVALMDDADAKATRRVVALEPGQPIYRILIVDDRWANRRLLTKLLLPFGFDLREAENGKEAIEITQVFQPHVIFMDMRMPVMDGMEATRQIKTTSDGQSTKIIALTASVFEEERSEVIAQGCDDFVRKPFRDDEIFTALKRHLNLEYIYAKDEQRTETQTDRIQPEELRAAMSVLPPELVAGFTEAIELGDMEMLDKTIKEIAEHNSTLAAGLGQLADRFEYDTLLNLVQEAVR